MNPRVRRNVLIAAALLLLALTYLYWRQRHPVTPVVPPPPPPPVAVSTAPVKAPPTGPGIPRKPTPLPPPVTTQQHPVKPPPPTGPVTAPGTPTAPPIVLHKELIPKNIEIVRCYYDREIMGPDTTFGFDINGSGFTDEFQKMIRVDPGGLDIRVKNLSRVTANQIHGEMVVGSAQTTEFVYPKVLINNLPVFRAPDPFAVVRPSEVLVIVFVSLSEDGRSGRFRAITNLDENMAKQFKIVTSNPGLEISPLEFRLPFAVEGIMQISAAVPQGEHGLSAYIGQHEIWKRDKIIRIVRPNVGLTGFVQGVSAGDKFHRPGDTVQLYLHGSGLTSTYTEAIKARVNELDMGPATFQFISASQMRFTFQAPANAPLREYGVTVVDGKNNELFKKDAVFTLVPPNWISGVQVAPPPKPGQTGLLRVVGRDISQDFVQNLEINVDEPGITLKNVRLMDASNVGADIAISSGVAPGDYWIHLIANGKEIQPPYGSLIKVEQP